MPDRYPFARDMSPSLLTLLNEVREAMPDARGFAWFDRRDALMQAGVPRAQVDSFDARDSAALERQIVKVRAAAQGGNIWPAFAGLGGDVIQGPPVATPIPAGPTRLERANRIAEEESARAWDHAERAGVRRPHNNRFDAERHARWTYRIAKEVGPGLATVIGIGHELTTLPWNMDEMAMDLHNNGVGIGQARAGGAMPDVHTLGLIIAPKGKK